MVGMADVVIVGAGAAGTAAAAKIARSTDYSVALIEAPPSSTNTSPERTWCFWEQGNGEYDDLLTASWDDAVIVDRRSSARRLRLAPFRYKMLSSHRYLAAMDERLAALGVERLTLDVADVWEADEGPRIRGRDGHGAEVVIEDARWVFDTRPTAPATGGTVHLLQHFRGWFVELPVEGFDPTAAVLMDFRTPQPAQGVSFGYVLPTSATTALIEYTEFSPAPLLDVQYDDALRPYVEHILGITDYTVTAVENGVIPMTDATFRRRIGPHTFRLGAAGGATRPSTGYTFAAAQRQASAVAVALAHGADPEPPAAYPARHLQMDGVLLRALDQRRIGGADFFTDLFTKHPTERVLRFLDGATTRGEELAIMRSAPRGPMMRSLLPKRSR
jgi:lycopene beta-cyclase